MLSLLREGDFAHPGEIDAIELVMKKMTKNPNQRLLDVGCGLGGTAHYLQQNGWGKVTGIDIDDQVLLEARSRYPHIDFRHCDATEANKAFSTTKFNVIYLFSAFFCFPSQIESLKALSQVADQESHLVIFDYSAAQESIESPFGWSEISRRFYPIEPNRMKQMLDHSGWTLKESQNITPRFQLWYENLIERFEQKKEEMISKFGAAIFNAMNEGYQQLLNHIKNGKVGGIVIYATKTP